MKINQKLLIDVLTERTKIGKIEWVAGPAPAAQMGVVTLRLSWEPGTEREQFLEVAIINRGGYRAISTRPYVIRGNELLKPLVDAVRANMRTKSLQALMWELYRRHGLGVVECDAICGTDNHGFTSIDL